MAFFPLFINLKNQRCLVVGGGVTALRKVQVLLDFEASVQVVAPEILPEIRELAVTEGTSGAEGELGNRLEICLREYVYEDLNGCTLVVAATDDREVNHRIAEACKWEQIPVNVVDQPEDCTFIFPSYVKERNLVAAFSSGGNSPSLTQYLKRREKEILTPALGDLAEELGAMRAEVQSRFQDPCDRKRFYEEYIRNALEKETNESE